MELSQCLDLGIRFWLNDGCYLGLEDRCRGSGRVTVGVKNGSYINICINRTGGGTTVKIIAQCDDRVSQLWVGERGAWVLPGNEPE